MSTQRAIFLPPLVSLPFAAELPDMTNDTTSQPIARDPRIATLCEHTERLASHIALQREQLAELRSRLTVASGASRIATSDHSWA